MSVRVCVCVRLCECVSSCVSSYFRAVVCVCMYAKGICIAID